MVVLPTLQQRTLGRLRHHRWCQVNVRPKDPQVAARKEKREQWEFPAVLASKIQRAAFNRGGREVLSPGILVVASGNLT